GRRGASAGPAAGRARPERPRDPPCDHRRSHDRAGGAAVGSGEGVQGARRALRPGGGAGGGRRRRVRTEAHAAAQERRLMELHERLQQAAGSPELAAVGTRDPFADVKNRIHLSLVSELGPRLFDAEDGDSVRGRVEAEIRTQLLQEAGLSREDRNRLAAEIADDIFGYGPLERLLPDATISEIMVNGPDEIWI